MKRSAIVLLVIRAAVALGADVRLGPETPLGPAPQFAAGDQLRVQVAWAHGHVVAAWTNSTSMSLSGSFDGTPLAFGSSDAGVALVGVAGGGKNFLVAFAQVRPDFSLPIVGRRIGLDGRLLDPAPLTIVPDVHNFWPGGVASNGTEYVVALNAKPPGLPSVIAPYLLTTGSISEDGVPGLSAVFKFNSLSSRPASPRVAWAGEHFVIGYAVQNFLSDPWGLSAMKFEPDADAGGALGTPSFPSLDAGGIDSRMAVGADRVTFAWLVSETNATRVTIAQTDLEGRAIGGEKSVAVVPRIDLGALENIEIAWDGSEYLVAWIEKGGLRGIRLRYDGTPLDGAPFDLAPGATASHVALAATGDGFLVAYSRADVASGGTQRTFARSLAALGEPPRRRSVRRSTTIAEPMNRRTFLRASTALAAAWKAPALLAQREPAADAPLPPSIAALTSMRDQAKPITNDERRARIEKARHLMGEETIGALVLTGGASLGYFTNIRWGGGERLFACVIPVKGEPFFVCPAFEEDRANEQIARGPFGGGHADVRTWQEDESPYALVAKGLADRGLATATIGVDENTKFVWSEGIAHAAPRARVVLGTPITAGCRMIKDAHELELMQVANSATLAVYKAVYQALQPGMTQNQVSELISQAYRRVGFPGEASVQTGPYTALPHGSITPQVIREGTIIMVDDGCTVEGYQSDITRTFVLGKASDAMNKVFGIVRRAQDAALAAAKPGAPLQSIDAAARDVIAGAGYGPGFKYFSHRLGHGIGMEGHEWPYLVKNNMFGWTRSLTARPGMTFSNEPGIYIRGEFGVRLEDDMVITADGARLFTPQSESLEKPF